MAGIATKFCRLPAQTVQLLSILSGGVVAELSRQNASRASTAPLASPLRRLCQASRAHTAPPEVPLRPTSSYPVRSRARRSLPSTPAVKAVWLPPPWHAIATRLMSLSSPTSASRLRRGPGGNGGRGNFAPSAPGVLRRNSTPGRTLLAALRLRGRRDEDDGHDQASARLSAVVIGGSSLADPAARA